MDSPFIDFTDRQLAAAIEFVNDLYNSGMPIEDIVNELQFTTAEVEWCLKNG